MEMLALNLWINDRCDKLDANFLLFQLLFYENIYFFTLGSVYSTKASGPSKKLAFTSGRRAQSASSEWNE